VIDDVQYLNINPKRVPIGHAEVEVEINDNGEEMKGLMVAGLVGTSVQGARTDDGKVVRNGQLSPVSAWWMFIPGERTSIPSTQSLGRFGY
jgi:hypothetical protein